MKSQLNPELQIMMSRAAIECNRKAVNAELEMMYRRKAWRVGLSLDSYCARFGVRQLWKVEWDNHEEQE